MAPAVEEDGYKHPGKPKVKFRTHRKWLAQLFPSGHPDSPVMWRFAIVRDDLAWEIDSVNAATYEAAKGMRADFRDLLWRINYYVRRLSISVLEGKSILDSEIVKKHKEQAQEHAHRDPLYRGLVDLTNKLNAVETLLRPIRVALGGHVRPKEAATGLLTHGSSEGHLLVNDLNAYGTSYRDFTYLALLFVWPEVTDLAGLMGKLGTFFQPVMQETVHLLAAIDGVLHAFWLDIGSLKLEREADDDEPTKAPEGS
jgi:hypothetical protein